jgi:hypothetical protein
MDDDLVKRLRSCANGAWLFKTKQGDFGICDDAADRIEALTAELDRARDKSEAKDGMDGAVVYAIRRLLNEANVPLAAFIDDHVLNAIIQRNVAEADNARLRAELTKAADSLDWADAHLEDAGVVSANVRYGARDARAALTGKETK